MIIGLAGVKESGKNTAAKFIAEEFGDEYTVKEWSFAEDLKKSAAAALGEKSDAVEFCNVLKEHGTLLVYMDDTEVISISGREYLQYYGTEAHREIFGDDFWVENLMVKIHPHFEDWDRLDLITDVRFSNEAEYIQAEGGKVIKIRRPEKEESGDGHASEKPLPDQLVDIEVINDSDLDEFRKRIIKRVEVWLGG